MSALQVKLTELEFDAPARKARAYDADQVDAALSQAQMELEYAFEYSAPAQVGGEIEDDAANPPNRDELPPLEGNLDLENSHDLGEQVGQLDAANLALRQALEAEQAERQTHVEYIDSLRNEIDRLNSELNSQPEPQAPVDESPALSPSTIGAAQILEGASKIAEEYVATARTYADNIVQEKNDELHNTQVQIDTLNDTLRQSVGDIRSYLSSLLEQTESFYPDGVPETGDVEFEFEQNQDEATDQEDEGHEDSADLVAPEEAAEEVPTESPAYGDIKTETTESYEFDTGYYESDVEANGEPEVDGVADDLSNSTESQETLDDSVDSDDFSDLIGDFNDFDEDSEDVEATTGAEWSIEGSELDLDAPVNIDFSEEDFDFEDDN